MDNRKLAEEIYSDNQYDLQIRGCELDKNEILFMIEKMALLKERELENDFQKRLKQTVNEACSWIFHNVDSYLRNDKLLEPAHIDVNSLLDDFRTAMQDAVNTVSK